MAITTKLEATGVAEYKRQMDQAKGAVKGLGEELKLCEAQYKATGDKATYLQEKTKLLQQQIKAQEEAVSAAESALQSVTAAYGENSTQAQAWKTKLVQARTALVNMNTELNSAQTALENLDDESLDTVQTEITETTSDADALASSVGGIAGKLDRETLINGLNSITDALASAAQTALNFGKNLWGATTGAAEWGESISDAAQIAEVSTTEYQQVEYAAQFFNASADSIFAARKRFNKALAEGSDIELSDAIRIETQGRDWLDVMFDVMDGLGQMEDANERNAKAQELFGRGYTDMLGLVAGGSEAFREKMDEAPIVSESDINNLTSANEAVKTMNSSLTALQNTLLAKLAPALETIADAVTQLVGQFSAWLETEEGKAAMENLSQAAVDLASALTDASFPAILEGIKGAVTALTDGLGWLGEHSSSVVTAVEAIAAAFVALKTATLGLNIMNIVNAAKNLTGADASATASAAGAGLGGTALKTICGGLLKVAPWLAGLYTLLNPAATADDEWDTLWHEDGSPTLAMQDITARQNSGEFTDFSSGLTPKVAEAAAAADEAISESIRNSTMSHMAEVQEAIQEAWRGDAGVDALVRMLASGKYDKEFQALAPDNPILGIDPLYRTGRILNDRGGLDMLSDLMNSAMETMESEGAAGAGQAADATVAGFISQINGSLAEYAAAGLSAAQAYAEGFASGLDIHSPSRVMAQLAKFTTAGFVQGIDATLGEVDAAASRMAAAAARPVARGAGTGTGNTYTSSSALYVDKYYQQTDMDVAAISAQLSQAQTRRQRGYGGR